jgi:hypothetical protein
MFSLGKLSQPSTGDRRKARKKTGRKPGRPVGALNKQTIQKQLKAQRELLEAANYKVATEHMDEQIGWLEKLVALLYPFDAAGNVVEGKSTRLYFRAFELFRDFLCMRAPYQSPRLSAVQVTPPRNNKRTVVNVTILNEKGEKVFSDVPEEKEDMKLIEGSLGEPR